VLVREVVAGAAAAWIDADDADDSLIDDLIESNEEFRSLLAKSLASPRKVLPIQPSP